MVYYGAVSKGCQRCRKRKIKCDQRKPGCLKCEKSDVQCPGYRNLNEVLFRDESDRIIRKAHQIKDSKSTLIQDTNALALCQSYAGISPSLSQPVTELGANFFFTKYTFLEPPYSKDSISWLARSYLEDATNPVLQLVIEAVGMLGISNVFHAPNVASKARRKYCNAMAAMKRSLNDPTKAVADTTFVAVMLFGLFETINFDSWNSYYNWAAHVKAATALLELRGREQFTRERGVQLYTQIRSQILLICMHQHMPVPPSLVRTACLFEASGIREKMRVRNHVSPASIAEISFRVVNLHAAIQNDKMIDSQSIRQAALAIYDDLKKWRACLPSNWDYTTIDVSEAEYNTHFKGKAHLYPNPWISELWNSWHSLRIVVSQMILQNEIRSSTPDNTLKSTTISDIQKISAEICISTSSAMYTPRALSLIWPLYIVCLEELNTRELRSFAVDRLRQIDESMGVRQAGLLADTVSERLNSSSGSHLLVPIRYSIPLVLY